MESVSNRFAGITKFNPHRNMYTSRHSKTQKIAWKTSKRQETWGRVRRIIKTQHFIRKDAS